MKCYYAVVLKTFVAGIRELVYPPHCPVCQKYLYPISSDDVLCQHCDQALLYNRPPFCLKCSRHLKRIHTPRCRQCSQLKLHFNFAWSACLYKDPLKKLISQFKYNQKTYLRKPFARFIKNFIQIYHLDIHQFDIIVPIPLYSSRLRERGYNQSRLLAEEIARTFNIPLSVNNLIRIRHTDHQTLLNEKERWTNIRGAFRIRNFTDVSGKNILLIDDLLTTGATASEAANTLKQAGAQTVGVLTLAITI